MAKLLIVDDEASILNVLTTLLRGEGHDISSALSGEQAKEKLTDDSFDLMLTDMRMSPINGLELLRFTRKECPEMGVIIMTAYASVDTAIEAMKQGAFDYVMKPFQVDDLTITIKRALEYNQIKAENADLKANLKARYGLDNIVAESQKMRRVCDMIQRVALTDVTVLITGESGTGKELVAKAVHANSNRKEKPFVPVNCAALPEQLLESELFGHIKGSFTGASSDKEGLFTTAHNGTIFLDEIESMPLSIQGKLLRVLQEKEVRRVGDNKHIKVDARVLAATNINLEDKIAESEFREDLFYRLAVIPIDLPPLRDRREDILPMVYHILRKLLGETAEMPKINADVQFLLEQADWPGNVRELENALKHAITFATDNVITKEVLPARLVASEGKAILNKVKKPMDAEDFRGKSLKAFLRYKEKEYLMQVLDKTNGDKAIAAKELNISLASLYRKLPEVTD